MGAHEEEKIAGQTKQLLLGMAEASPVRMGGRRGCKRLVDELLGAYPRYANLGVISTNGEVLATAVPPASSLNLADRQFFKRALATGDFSVGEFQVERGIGKPTINFGLPAWDRYGQVQAVVFAALDLDWFSRFGSQLPARLPRGGTWTEMDRNGLVLIHYPDPKPLAGKPLPNKTLLKQVLAGRSEGVIEAFDEHGVPTLYAYAAMQSQFSPGTIVTLLGIRKKVLFAGADRLLRRDLTWLGLAACLALVLGWFGSSLLILRPVKALVKSSARLAAGDLSARTGLPHSRDELGRLTLSFDLMAQALEQRELDHQHASQKLQVLSQRLVEVQETERRHIARELHDEIGQSLTVAEMNLQAALQAPREASLERRLEDSIHAVERVLEQVHDLSLNLRPSMLDDLGLEAALRWYTHRQAALTGLEVEFHADPLENRIDPVIETECFRVAQEALTNIVRHSKARFVSVDLRQKDGELRLSVRDDGVGFDVASVRDKAVQGASLGLLSMEERAALANGGLEFVSVPGEGTEVRAWFPLKWQTVEVT